MSFAFAIMTLLLGSSMVMTFEPGAAGNSPLSGHRCHGESLQSIRKSLLGALNLQTEPRLPAGAVDSVREQWNQTFSIISPTAEHTAIPAVPGYSASPDSGNSGSLKCCSVASEISMKDLGWDSWVIHPLSLTIIRCALCNSAMNTVQCPSSHFGVHDANPQHQVPCCEPIAQEMVPVVYMDESNIIVISSMQLTRSCGCGVGNAQGPSKE